MARRLAAVGAVLVLLCLTACSGGPVTEPQPAQPSSAASPTRPPFRTVSPGPLEPTGTPVAVPPSRWDAILADLAARGVTGPPELVSAEAVTWNNGALGCPSPGVSYTQALVDGMRVVVTVDGKTYDYRFGTADTPKLCTR